MSKKKIKKSKKQEEEEEGLDAPDDPGAPMGDEPEMGDAAGPEPEPIDPGPEEPMGDASLDAEGAVDADPEQVKEMVMDILDMVMDAAKEKFGAAAPEGEIVDDGDAAPDMDLPMDAPEAGEEAGEEEGGMGALGGDEEDDLAMENIFLEDDSLEEDFVNEVTRRVAARLIKATRK